MRRHRNEDIRSGEPGIEIPGLDHEASPRLNDETRLTALEGLRDVSAGFQPGVAGTDQDSLSAQDPSELFDVVTADGAPTGIVKRRADVHRDGNWHRAIHVWIVGIHPDLGPFLMFQRRSLLKDTMPGRLDATVGGHVRSGESLEETLRETEEEIGRPVTPAELIKVGRRRAVNDREPGIIDRELQDVFLVRDDGPLTGFRPHPSELAALVQVSLSDVELLLEGKAASVASYELSVFDGTVAAGHIEAGELPVRLHPYLRAVMDAGRAHLNDEPVKCREIP